jgi:hypothetical protein
MPQYDGTGPRGQGPMSGRGEGYCAIRLPAPGRPACGFAGLQAVPVHLSPRAPANVHWMCTVRWAHPAVRWRRRFDGGRAASPCRGHR